jgi:hypothetical protein
MSTPKAVQTQRWFRLWRNADRPAPDTDPADLGTAFGLEMSLLEPPADPPAPAATHGPAWMHRFTARRRPAA